MEICVTMHVDYVGSIKDKIRALSADELKNLVLTCQQSGIVIDMKSIILIGNELWADRKGGKYCDLAWDEEFRDSLDWHTGSSDN
jgi:hypothetical protein